MESATDYTAENGLELTRYFNTATGKWTFGFEGSIESYQPLQYASYSAFATKSTPYATASDACQYGWNDLQGQTIFGGSGATAKMTATGCEVFVGAVPKMRLNVHAYSQGSLPAQPAQRIVHRPDGRSLYFQFQNGAWVGLDGGVSMQLTQDANGYTLRTGGNNVEHYNTQGQLIDFAENGRTFTLTRSGNQLTVADPFGRYFTATYSNGLVAHVDLPDQSAIDYAYNGNQLTQVSFSNGETEGYTYTAIGDETLLAQHLYNGQPYASWTYDNIGRATSSQHAGGAERVTFEYGNNYTRVTEPLGAQRVYWTTQVKDVPRLSDVADNSGKVYEHRTYDANGFLTSDTDALGNVTTYVHDTMGRETRRTEGAGSSEARTISTTYDSGNPFLPASITTPKLATFYSYDSAGRVLNKTKTDMASGAQRSWSYTYNAQGALLSIDGPRTDVADVTEFQYDSAGDLTAIIDALGHTTAITAHDGSGRPTTLVDPNGLTVNLSYDVRGRLTSKTVGSERTRLTYTLAGDLQTLTLPSGDQYTCTYDDARRLIAIRDNLGNHIDYTLDAGDNRVDEKVTSASGTVTRHLRRVFDSLGELAQTIAASGATTSYSYDANQNLTSTTDALGHTTTRTYDALNRLSEVTDALNGTATYGYDSQDVLTGLTDPDGNATSYTANGFGNITRQQSPDTGATTFTYDGAGNVVSRINANGQTASYSYDALNRLTQASYADGTVTYGYDSGTNGNGHLTSVTDNSGSTTWSYDQLGHVTVKRQTVGGVTLNTAYGYDSAGRLTSITYPSGKVVGYGYSGSRITSVTVNGTAILSNVAYAPFGSATRWIFGNGMGYSRSFDQDGQETSFTLGSDTRSLSYDGAGNITGQQDSLTNLQLGYDALNHLTSANDSAFSLGWSYDANGNRLQQTSASGNTSYTYDAGTNRLNGIDGSVYAIVKHDADGNRIGDGNHTYQYDARDRLISVDNGTTGTYRYNALGERVYKEGKALAGDLNGDGVINTADLHTVNGQSSTSIDCPGPGQGQGKGQTTACIARQIGNYSRQSTGNDANVSATQGTQKLVFAYNEAGQLLGEYTLSGVAQEETVWLGDLPVATLQGSGTYYIYPDQLGTPRAITNQLGNTIWRWDSEPFGSTAPNEDPDGNGQLFTYNLRFPGQYFDEETGLYYNLNRDYDPGTGRYIESDPIGLAGGLNSYTYVLGNPISWIDPTGLDATDWWNNSDGRNPATNGPTNGNWGGKCWSGGTNSCGGNPMGNAPPTDSGDQCYRRHDNCYAGCGANEQCVAACDKQLVTDLKKLPDDSKKWPNPPRPGTEGDSERYRWAAIQYFSK